MKNRFKNWLYKRKLENLNKARKEARKLILVRGYVDVWSYKYPELNSTNSLETVIEALGHDPQWFPKDTGDSNIKPSNKKVYSFIDPVTKKPLHKLTTQEWADNNKERYKK